MERVVCLNCIDGRAQLPVINWIKKEYEVENVDMITEPGMDGLLSNENNGLEDIFRKINISIDKNDAKIIFVVGHNDCKGNPVDESVHKEHVLKGVERLKAEFVGMAIQGLWVNDKWDVEKIS